MFVPKKKRASRAPVPPVVAPAGGDKLAYGRREAARLISVSFNHLRKQIKEGKLKAFKSGGRVLVTRRALDAYLAGESR
jgi:excisionase family DNA binding protein